MTLADGRAQEYKDRKLFFFCCEANRKSALQSNGIKVIIAIKVILLLFMYYYFSRL